MNSYNSVLRRQRDLRGWSRQDLVNEIGKLEPEYELGLDVKTVARWEKGECKPSHFYRKRLCLLFSMNAEELGIM